MFSNPSAPSGWPNSSNAFIPVQSNLKDSMLFLVLSLPLRQRVINNLNAFSQLLHGKPTSKSDALTSENHRLVIQLMSLRIRSNEERLLARINESEKPTYTVSGQSAKAALANVFATNTSAGNPSAAPFGTRLVSEITWGQREKIISNLVANFNLAILNKAHLTDACKMDLLRENDELVRVLSTLPTRPTTEPVDQPVDTLYDSLEHLKIGENSALDGQLTELAAELEIKLKQRDSQLEFRLNEIMSNFDKDKFSLSGLVHNVQTRLNLVESSLHRLGSESERELDKRIRSYFPCTFRRTGRSYESQEMYNCFTCKFEASKVVCRNCIDICHKGHNTKLKSNSGFCDCGSGEYSNKCELNGKS